MTASAHKTEGVNRTKKVRFYPFVSTGNGASSRGTRRADNARGQFDAGRFLFWTEDSRMHAAIDEKFYSYYTYDHSGGSCASREQSQACLSYAEMELRRRSQRRLKFTGENNFLDVNADFMVTYTCLDEPTLYPSSYMVLIDKGYTKHYYAGAERVAARIGGGCLNAMHPVLKENTKLQELANILFDQSKEQILYRILPENKPYCIMENEFAKDELQEIVKDIPSRVDAEVTLYIEQFRNMIHHMVYECEKEPDVFFYHSDHLGSASWITDFEGIAVQHLQYLPYGERYVDQRTSGYNERFAFTGKEKDEETGYGYFGARYMDHELMTMWLSVDPMADKYPNISPYAYCAWNPIKLVDPDGREITLWIVGDDGNTYSYNQGKIYDKSGAEYSGNDRFVQATKASLDRNREYEGSKSTIDYFSRQPDDKESITIKRYDGITNTELLSYDSKTEKRIATILYNPTMGLADEKNDVLTPATCLQHELGHVANAQYVDPVFGDMTSRRMTPDPVWQNKEEAFNIRMHEHGLAIHFNELERKSYNIGIDAVTVSGPLSQKIEKRWKL